MLLSPSLSLLLSSSAFFYLSFVVFLKKSLLMDCILLWDRSRVSKSRHEARREPGRVSNWLWLRRRVERAGSEARARVSNCTIRLCARDNQVRDWNILDY